MSWKKVKLGDVIKHKKGSIIIDDTMEYKLCRVQLHRRGVLLRGLMKGSEIRTKKQQICRAGDFLVAEMDAKVGGYGFVPDELDGAIVSSHYFLFELDEQKIRPGFLDVISQLHILQDQIKAVGSTNYAAIRPYTVLNWEIPITTIEQQIEIENLFHSNKKKGELLSTELTYQRSLVQQLRRQLLQDAVQGKLVPQNPADEPADVLLRKIKAEKERMVKEKKIKKDKEIQPVTAEEIPFALPKGWVWCRLGEIAFSMSTGPFGSMLHKSDYVKKGIPLVNPMNIVKEKIISSDNMMVSEGTKQRLENYILLTGDIVVARRGEMGRCAEVTKHANGWLCGTGSFFIRLHSNIYRSYFVKLFSSDYAKNSLLNSSVGSTMSNLNHRILNNFLFPLPPLAEQHRIVEKLEELIQTCNALEANIGLSREYNEKLLLQVLRQALQV